MTAPLTYTGGNGQTYTRYQPKPTLAPLNSLGLKTPVMGTPQAAPTVNMNLPGVKPAAGAPGGAPSLNLSSLASLTPGAPTPPASAPPPNIIPPPPSTGTPSGPAIQDQGGSLMLPANPNGGPNPATGSTASTPAAPVAATGSTASTPAAPVAAAGSTAGDVANIGAFGPGSDLLYQEIDPATGQRLGGTQSAVDAQAAKVAAAPNLSQASLDQLNSYINATDPAYQRDLRAVGEKAAALGRVGAGMTTNELTDVSTQRERDILNAEQALAGQTAAASNTQNLQNLSALSGLESQQYGEGAATRNELRGERGYEAGTNQQALSNNANQIALQDQLLNSMFNRDQAQTQLEAQTGFSQNPSQDLLAQAGYYGDLAAQSGASAGGLLSNIAYLQAMKNNPVPSYGGPGGAAPATVLPQDQYV